MTPAAAVLLFAQAVEPIGPPPPAPSPKPEYVVPIVHALALETAMRIGESILYPDPFSRTQYFGAHYKEAFTKAPIFDPHKPAFEWDGDPWQINVIGHGLFGSELYLRSRMCHLRWYGALAFAAAGSTLWEYAFEGNGARPSVEDLVYTPLMGFRRRRGTVCALERRGRHRIEGAQARDARRRRPIRGARAGGRHKLLALG